MHSFATATDGRATTFGIADAEFDTATNGCFARTLGLIAGLATANTWVGAAFCVDGCNPTRSNENHPMTEMVLSDSYRGFLTVLSIDIPIPGSPFCFPGAAAAFEHILWEIVEWPVNASGEISGSGTPVYSQTLRTDNSISIGNCLPLPPIPTFVPVFPLIDPENWTTPTFPMKEEHVYLSRIQIDAFSFTFSGSAISQFYTSTSSASCTGGSESGTRRGACFGQMDINFLSHAPMPDFQVEDSDVIVHDADKVLMNGERVRITADIHNYGTDSASNEAAATQKVESTEACVDPSTMLCDQCMPSGDAMRFFDVQAQCFGTPFPAPGAVTDRLQFTFMTEPANCGAPPLTCDTSGKQAGRNAVAVTGTYSGDMSLWDGILAGIDSLCCFNTAEKELFVFTAGVDDCSFADPGDVCAKAIDCCVVPIILVPSLSALTSTQLQDLTQCAFAAGGGVFELPSTTDQVELAIFLAEIEAALDDGQSSGFLPLPVGLTQVALADPGPQLLASLNVDLLAPPFDLLPGFQVELIAPAGVEFTGLPTVETIGVPIGPITVDPGQITIPVLDVEFGCQKVISIGGVIVVLPGFGPGPDGMLPIEVVGSSGGVPLYSATVALAVVDAGPPCPQPFVRGDANGSGAVDIADAIAALGYLFGNGPPADPLEAADINNDGWIDISDAVYLLQYLFAQGPEPATPFPDPGCP